MWPILATLCICAASADGTHEDAPMMLQVNAVADFGKRPSKTPNIFFSDSTLKIKTLDDWHSDRDLAFVPPPIPLYFTKGLNISIVSAVPVYEQLSNGSHASYIAVVTDHPGAQSDISQHRWNWTQGQWEYLENQSLEKQSLETIREEEAGHYFTISSEETNKNNPSAENVKEHVSRWHCFCWSLYVVFLLYRRFHFFLKRWCFPIISCRSTLTSGVDSIVYI